MESEDTSLGTFGPNVTLNREVCSPDTRGTMEDPKNQEVEATLSTRPYLHDHQSNNI